MKSLEIVNHDLEICEKGDTNVGFMYKNELETIKQDLEVLEIIRKYIPENWNGFQIIMSDKKTKYEDWKKLKQWLEGNEE